MTERESLIVSRGWLVHSLPKQLHLPESVSDMQYWDMTVLMPATRVTMLAPPAILLEAT